MIFVTGIDIGSAFTKAVIMAERRLVSHSIVPSGGNYKLAADEVVREALAEAKLSFADIGYTVATGCGGAGVSFSNELVNDISCDCRGVSYIFPSARTVIDIGGQFTKVFRLDEGGRPTAFLQSEKCAAGSGRFLQIIAKILQIDLKDIGEISLRSKKKVDFNTGCAVFAESEAISKIAEGVLKEDILAGLHRSLATKIQTLLERLKMVPECVVVGGGANDIGLVRSIEERLGYNLLVPDEPQIVAAMGAALIAEEKVTNNKLRG